MEDIRMGNHQELLDRWHRCRPCIVNAALPNLIEGLGHGRWRPLIEGHQGLKFTIEEAARLPGSEIFHDLMIRDLSRALVLRLPMLSNQKAPLLAIGICLVRSLMQSE